MDRIYSADQTFPASSPAPIVLVPGDTVEILAGVTLTADPASTYFIQSYDGVVTNDGTIATTHNAVLLGEWSVNPGFTSILLNNGTINGSGSDQLGSVVATSNSDEILINNGTISYTGTGTGIGSRDLGREVISCYKGNVVNTGMIETTAGTLAVDYVDGGNLSNSGKIIGNILLDNLTTGAASSLVNTGAITGWITFGPNSDRVDNHHGTITGTIDLGDGYDVLSSSDGTVGGTIAGGLGNDRISTGDEANIIYGDTVGGDTTGGNDVVASGGGSDTVYGGGGNDTIDGGAGNDRLDGGSGANLVSYATATSGVTVSLAAQGSAQNTVGDGIDTLYNFQNLTGSAFNDRLFGDGNANLISGGAGFDVISGGGGRDALFGGAGGDRFLFTAVSDSPYGPDPDVIVDFTSGTDKIDLTALHLTSTNQIRIVTNDGNTYVLVDVDKDGAPDMMIEALGAASVKLGDIIIGIAPSAAIHSIDVATSPAHHDLDAAPHAAPEHGLYG